MAAQAERRAVSTPARRRVSVSADHHGGADAPARFQVHREEDQAPEERAEHRRFPTPAADQDLDWMLASPTKNAQQRHALRWRRNGWSQEREARHRENDRTVRVYNNIPQQCLVGMTDGRNRHNIAKNAGRKDRGARLRWAPRACEYSREAAGTQSPGASSQSGRRKMSLGLEPSGGPMMPSCCIWSRMRAARP